MEGDGRGREGSTGVTVGKTRRSPGTGIPQRRTFGEGGVEGTGLGGEVTSESSLQLRRLYGRT